VTLTKKELKRLYDIEYRKKQGLLLKAKKQAYYRRDYQENPDKYRLVRLRKRDWQRAYAKKYNANPEWKAYKKEYDREYRAKRKFGDWWVCHVLLMKLEDEIGARMSKYEIGLQNKTINKAMNRGRRGQIKRSYT
jgi:hypothetical protein